MSKSVLKTVYRDMKPFITKDGSEIRELMHPAWHGARSMSLAEAVVAPHTATQRHQHAGTEEFYHVTAGAGRMHLGDESFEVKPGDTVCIPPGTSHWIENTGDMDLRILCCCTPAYSHEDTDLL